MIRNFINRSKIRCAQAALVILGVFVTSVVSTCFTMQSESALAASLSGFKAGNIISDEVMSNYNSMSVADIQKFLTSKNPCNNTNYNLYVEQSNRYPTVKWHWNNGHFVCISEERFGDGTTIGSGQTAAEIIYGAAQANRINPQVLIVLLEKEQGLITDTYPHSGQFRAATGYGCPDTAACDSKYYGFKNQVYRAAELFRYTLDHGYSVYPDKKRGVYVGYNPSSSCGRSEVYIENRATSALYRYTPYQPNSAALAAGYGLGDSCSSYGNRNFYMYFNDWFGSTQNVPNSAPSVQGEQIVIPDGTYSLVSKLSTQRTLGVSGTNTQLANLNDSNNKQRWKFQRSTSTGNYKITNVATGQPLTLASTAVKNGTNAQVSSSNSQCSQQWKITLTSDKYLAIESACSRGMMLDVYDARSASGTNVHAWAYNGTNAQKWTIRVGRTIKDGVYHLQSALNSNQEVVIQNNQTHNDANINIYSYSVSENHKWQAIYDSNTDYYTFVNPATGKALDVHGGTASNGTNVSLWERNNTCAQQWKVVSRGNGKYSLLSGCSLRYSLDVYGGNASNNTNVSLWDNHNNASEQWSFKPAAPVIASGRYNIVSKTASNAAVDVYGAWIHNGANVSIWELHSRDSEIWDVTYLPETGYYRISNPAADKSLDVSNADTHNGANVQIWGDNGTCAQRWIPIKLGGTYEFLSACNVSKVLDLSNASPINSTNIQLWDRNKTNAQRWSLVSR